MRSDLSSLSLPQDAKNTAFPLPARKQTQTKVALVFEDSRVMRTAFRRMLAELSIHAICLPRNAGIIEAIEREKPHLVFACAKDLADVCKPELPRETGSEHHATIIALADHNDPGSVFQALSRGADDYLIKPFDRAVLKSKLSCHGLM